MKREYLQVTHTTAQLDPQTITTSLASLHKLTKNDTNGSISRLNPLRNDEPVTFEFIAISEGRDEPVEFYYGADDRIDVLKQRLRSIYPSSFDIDPVEIDLVGKLLKQGANGRPLDDVTPSGVRWRGSVDRRKDWMTTLSGFSQAWKGDRRSDEDMHQSGHAPLAPLIDQLTNAEQPLTFQVLFQRKSDWSIRPGGGQAHCSPGRIHFSSRCSRLSPLATIEAPVTT